jgi:hypothetical protein
MLAAIKQVNIQLLTLVGKDEPLGGEGWGEGVHQLYNQ